MTYVCVIGWPIEHSKSPFIYGYWMKQHGVHSFYIKRAVRPEDLATFVETAWQEGLYGFNATIPHKEALMDFIEADKIAQAIGAINTVYRTDRGFMGTNTDGQGWWASLGLSCLPKSALVLGAGGAAKAIVYTLRQKGVSLTLSNRSRARAEAFGVPILDWPGAKLDGRGYDLIVNASACGLNGQHPIRLTHLDPGTVVSDLVYIPLETELLASARILGGVPIDGLGMLLHQAAGGFEKWFGMRPEVSAELRAYVLSQ